MCKCDKPLALKLEGASLATNARPAFKTQSRLALPQTPKSPEFWLHHDFPYARWLSLSCSDTVLPRRMQGQNSARSFPVLVFRYCEAGRDALHCRFPLWRYVLRGLRAAAKTMALSLLSEETRHGAFLGWSRWPVAGWRQTRGAVAWLGPGAPRSMHASDDKPPWGESSRESGPAQSWQILLGGWAVFQEIRDPVPWMTSLPRPPCHYCLCCCTHPAEARISLRA